MTARPLLAKLRTGLAISALALAVSACGSTKWGFPYRAEVQQGNWITAEQVARLERGMSREQVRFVLGTPTLQDVFHADRWDYTYYHKPGYGEPEVRRFTVWFEGDLLARWEGDQQPEHQPFQAPGPLPTSDTDQPRSEEAPGELPETEEQTGSDAPQQPLNRPEVEINAPQSVSPLQTPNHPSPEPLR